MKLMDRSGCSSVCRAGTWAEGCTPGGAGRGAWLHGWEGSEPPCKQVAAPGRMLDCTECSSAVF